MKQGKKILSLVMVMVACLTIIVVCGFSLEASAAGCYGVGDCINGVRYGGSLGETYATVAGLCNGYGDDGIKYHNKLTGTITIPETVTIRIYENEWQYHYENRPVTCIGAYGFNEEKDIKKIILSETITEIQNNAFEKCKFLEEINIPKNVSNIGWRAFSGCSELKKINLPDGLTTIGREAFYGCNFEKLELTDNLTTVHNQAFMNCSVKNLTIDRKECNFTLPSAENIIVTEKAENLDNLCSLNTTSQPNLKNVSVDEDNQYFSSKDGVLFNKDKTNLILYPTAKEDIIYNMPNSVERICSYAFYNNKNLEYVKLPDSLKYIEEYSFYYCSNLGSISIIPNGVEEIELLAFGNHAITDVYFNGTEAEWKSVEVINSSLNVGAFYPTVTMHFNDEIPPTVDPPAPEPEEPDEPDVPDIPTDHEHFYDDEEDETCNICGYDRTENCDCRCHNDSFFAKIFWKITNFFNKIFKKNKICDCGIAHY